MKKVILINLLLAMCSLKLSAQTKDETIKWITEKFISYGKTKKVALVDKDNYRINYSYYNEKSYLEVHFTVTKPDSLKMNYYVFNDDEWPGDIDGDFAFRLADIVNFEIKSIEGIDYVELFAKSKIAKTYFRAIKNSKKGVFKLEYVDYIIFPLKWDTEYDLKPRMIKALTKLIAFNNASMPKQAF